MWEGKKNKIYTAADIEKYHKGLLSSKEMNELEKAALDDPFLADALEGYGSTSIDATADLSDLEQKLQHRTSRSNVIAMVPPRPSFTWWRPAAAIVIIGGLGYLSFKLTKRHADNSVAKLEQKKSEQVQPAPIPDSNKSTIADTPAVAINGKTGEKITAETSERKQPPRAASQNADSNSAVAAATDISSVPSYEQGKNDSLSVKPNAEGVAAVAKAKKAEAGNPQQGVVANERVLREQQMNSFRGRVVDGDDNPLPFANITNTSDNVGTYADAKGYFTLISADSVLDVRVRSVGFQNHFTQLKNSVAGNRVVMQEDRTAPDKVLSFQKRDTNRLRGANVTFEEPEPADGWNNYGTYLANNIKVPEDVNMKHDIGQVQVSFEVDANGEPVNIKVEKSLCPKCDEEAVRLIREGPKWKKKNRKAKRVTVTVPFDTQQ